MALEADLFIDSATRVLLPRHRWRIEFVTSNDQRFTADDIHCTRHLVWDNTRMARSPEPEHIYGVAIRTAGLAVTGPDSIGLSATAIVPIDIETYSLGGAEWMDVVLELPTNGATPG